MIGARAVHTPVQPRQTGVVTLNLDLGRYITDVSLVGQRVFLDSQKAFLDSLSREELARFNLSSEIRSRAELLAEGYTDEDVTVARLHYTVLLHLGRVLELLAVDNDASPQPWSPDPPFDRYAFFEAFTRLSGVSDLADELLARRTNPGEYEAWSERQGQNARLAWRSANSDPLRPIRSYRNRLVHGRIVPELLATAFSASGAIVGTRLFYPRLDRVDAYLDWRKAFEEIELSARPGPGSAVAIVTPPADFNEASVIVGEVWEQVIDHVERSWRAHLMPSV